MTVEDQLRCFPSLTHRRQQTYAILQTGPSGAPIVEILCPRGVAPPARFAIVGDLAIAAGPDGRAENPDLEAYLWPARRRKLLAAAISAELGVKVSEELAGRIIARENAAAP